MSSSSSNVRHPRDCCICLETLGSSDVVQLVCGHTLCGPCWKGCTKRWDDNKRAFERYEDRTLEDILNPNQPTRPELFPKPNCPLCRKSIHPITGIVKHWIDYSNEYLNTEVPNSASEEERNKVMYRRLRNFKTRARKAKRNGEPEEEMPADLKDWNRKRLNLRKSSS